VKEEVHLCVCEGEGVAYQYDEDGLLFSMWRFGYGVNGKDWRTQLRHIWYVLKYGHPWADDVIMDWSTAKEFAEGILRVAESPPNEDQTPVA